MFRPLSIFIGTRYTRAKRRNRFVSFISMTSMIGLALGVLAMIVVLSVMNGFQREMSNRILGMVPHATIVGVKPIDDWRPVAEAAIRKYVALAREFGLDAAQMALAFVNSRRRSLTRSGFQKAFQSAARSPASLSPGKRSDRRNAPPRVPLPISSRNIPWSRSLFS